jgi:Fe-S cluster assembly ATP-binding protein
MEKTLEIQNLTVALEEKTLIQNLSLTIKEGEIHALMGPNGAGKSSLTKVLAGHPSYKVKEGKIFFENENLLSLSVETRAGKGIFVSFQENLEIPALKNFQFFFSAYNAQKKAQRKKELSEEEFFLLLQEKMNFLQLPSGWEERAFNEGFSGGEKKKNELLQLLL